ncbi:helix-turn-helix domain-containing protein [Leptothoe spongobia]|uniref:Helix-turn-helix domain-containing protein n=1 Tax=Leptothoe spongobia TAU-MAC 1115 TaxID=1967444 RepID=A0A947DHE7_9CYAN|nr:helix-turn-helix transcriptional regulator [Leptothoe spongobia]MBT9316714.1 helix-turn-helix domain-containing protein [Leptothoe spongobia TAU-MAC 1115]
MSVFPNTIGASHTSEEYCEQLVTVGHYLKTIRTRQGLSLQQVAQQTHIQPNQLRAIEAGNWMKLPEAIYVKGFLKKYAQSLGLDGKAIADKVWVKPAAFNPQWLNKSDFCAREPVAGPSLRTWWAIKA